MSVKSRRTWPSHSAKENPEGDQFSGGGGGGSWCKTPCSILSLKCAKPSLQLHKRPPICLFQDQLDLTEVSEVRHNLPGDLPQQPKFHLIKHIKVGLRQSFKVS